MKRYSVYVGDCEVNDYYLTKEQAEDLAEEYRKDGYDDVAIEEFDLDETGRTYRRIHLFDHAQDG